MPIGPNYMSPGSPIVGRGGSAVPESLGAVGVPVYSHSEVLIGSAIMLALFLVVLIALAVAWWRFGAVLAVSDATSPTPGRIS